MKTNNAAKVFEIVSNFLSQNMPNECTFFNPFFCYLTHASGFRTII